MHEVSPERRHLVSLQACLWWSCYESAYHRGKGIRDDLMPRFAEMQSIQIEVAGRVASGPQRWQQIHRVGARGLCDIYQTRLSAIIAEILHLASDRNERGDDGDGPFRATVDNVAKLPFDPERLRGVAPAQ